MAESVFDKLNKAAAKKAGVASKPVVTAALKEEVSVSVEAGMAAPTSVVAVAKKMVPVKKTVVKTKASAATEVVEVVEVVKKRGRPPLGDARMSDTEYKRRWREKQKSSRS
ncbi:hypothetical protein RCZAHN_112 [Rhodobacter phage RcZahn]|nr:hypothetical protein RCZAHN_112 [Rhodobacter phage RcZahn]